MQNGRTIPLGIGSWTHEANAMAIYSGLQVKLWELVLRETTSCRISLLPFCITTTRFMI